ncbi:MAG: heme-binding protein [Acidimicrobiales bacterium]
MDGLIDQRHPSLAQALELLAQDRAEADARELSLALTVVDAGGHVIASQWMDGAALGAMRLATGKAYTAVLWGARAAAISLRALSRVERIGASTSRTSASSSMPEACRCSPATV